MAEVHFRDGVHFYQAMPRGFSFVRERRKALMTSAVYQLRRLPWLLAPWRFVLDTNDLKKVYDQCSPAS